MATTTSTAPDILKAVGGADNILHFTHCATRLRFELKDASVIDQAAVEAIPGVLGAVPQSGDRYQIIIGATVANVYNAIMDLPEMKNQGGTATSGTSDADVKAAARAKARGKNAYVDAFFEYLSNSFRPLLGVLLGASLIIAFTAVLDAFHIVDFRGDKSAGWVFVDAMWRAVFYFLPIMVAYNASKTLKIDPWLGATVMGAVMTPEFLSLSTNDRFQKAHQVVCTTNETLGTTACKADIFGLPMQLNDYGGQVFVPLIMVAILAIVYRFLVKVVPDNVQMVFVPFFSMLVMIPVTAFLIGPLGIWLGTGLGTGLAWLNSNAPIFFAILIPMLYPFLVPLGLHWPLNALMLANISSLGYDFIQGPMGAWNFACFGATAGVLVLSIRDKNYLMRQTATGALAAGLFGGISEPSLYGIHLRYKNAYKRMLPGCFVGGLVIGLASMAGLGSQTVGSNGEVANGVTTKIFAFTSLFTIPVFDPMWLYGVAILAAFLTAMFLVIIFDYRTPEQKAEMHAADLAHAAKIAAESAAKSAAVESAHNVSEAAVAPAADACDSANGDSADESAVLSAFVPGATTVIGSPLSGMSMPLDEVPDAVFAGGLLGKGAGVDPAEHIEVKAPAAGKVVTAPASGHAFGIELDSGVEILIHVGLDTVKLGGEGFDVRVSQGDHVVEGQTLVVVDRAVVEAAGYPLVTPVVITNTDKFESVDYVAEGDVSAGDPLIAITAKM
ncbi:glucose PTS transporter subunit IIA [Actinomyces vulturis]|uniref:glucose PTS transporter subunit IIA n=1 Tax=Actinomyces vulturis TaxID=1857645 RepID=UPI0008319392|nr:glucose PTS transporter subunit IIA [Actinomyces vulturis]